jgi:uncharacterized protein with GYD domain
METYVVLMTMTPKGLDEIARIPDFVESLEPKFRKLGGNLTGFYKTMGEIDYVALFTAPDDKVALSFVAAFGFSKYFETTTLKGYSMSDLRKSLDIFGRGLA